ncbi:MAG: hypothetical protein K0S65_6810, partial [Labilithrix sp.]|nr:hypothetical protein [Labilithrix sp.]
QPTSPEAESQNRSFVGTRCRTLALPSLVSDPHAEGGDDHGEAVEGCAVEGRVDARVERLKQGREVEGRLHARQGLTVAVDRGL